MSRSNSEGLMAVCEGLLLAAGWGFDELDGIAVAVGPGSFTGVRIGVATAKALAYALDLPVGPVVTLDAMAANVGFCEMRVCPLVRARRDLVYTATYHVRGSAPQRLTEYEVSPIDEVLRRLGETEAGDGRAPGIVFVGDGALAHRGAIADCLAGRALIGPPWTLGARPAVVAALGLRAIDSGEGTDAAGLVPFYLGRSAAEAATACQSGTEGGRH